MLGHRAPVDLHHPVHGHQPVLPGLLQDLEVDLADVIAREQEVVDRAASRGEDVMGHDMRLARGFVLQNHCFPALLEKS
jgi:hypothetical protein